VRIALSGYYGCGNAGDEAVLAGIAESFRQRAGERVSLIALSQHPEQTTRLHGLRSVDRMNLGAVRRTLRECELLLSGGGSLLQDTTSLRSLLYYLWIAQMAFRQGVPVMFYAQGIGPLHRSLSRFLVRLVANRTACITVRDAPSARLLAEIGVKRPPIEVTADPAFALHPASPDIVDACFRTENLPTDTPLIGVALRPWGVAAETPLDTYAGLLTALQNQCAARVVLLPMQIPEDVAFAERVAQRTGSPDAFPTLRHAYPPETLLGVVARMQAVVAMRLHTLIFAVRSAVPPFALAYDPKVTHLMNGLGLSDSLQDWREFDPVQVAGQVVRLLSERSTRLEALRAQSAALEQRALRNVDRALNAI
jgi:polysaccharide pyruvyl transferase CsaB